jgi:hypothetical protein
MQESAGGVVVAITLDDLAGRSAETIARERAVLQAKLQCVEAERDRIVNDLVPKLLEVVATSRPMTIIGQITGRAAIGGGTMGGDTYSNYV